MNYAENRILGIDVGGSGIKGNIVDIKTGELLAERLRIKTPSKPSPYQIAEIIKKICEHFNYKGIVGCGFPAVVQNGVIKTAANISEDNLNINANKLFSELTKNKVIVYNDADTAGTAEIKFGGGKNEKNLVLMLTIGTGIGSALFVRQVLVPNTELGHIYMENGLIAEKYTSDLVRKKQDLNWKDWGKRFNVYLNYIEKLFNPDLIIIGGGTSKKLHKFMSEIDVQTKIIPAELRNNAGIIGAAILAYQNL